MGSGGDGGKEDKKAIFLSSHLLSRYAKLFIYLFFLFALLNTGYRIQELSLILTLSRGLESGFRTYLPGFFEPLKTLDMEHALVRVISLEGLLDPRLLKEVGDLGLTKRSKLMT